MDEHIKKAILYITYDGLTDPLGQSQVLPYVVGLSKQGYRFTVLSCEKRDRFLRNKSIVQRIVSDNGIDWVPVPYHKKPPVLSTVLDIQRMKRTARRLHKEKAFDLVHCRSYIGSLVGLYLKERFGIKYLFDMRGFWADEKVDAGTWNLHHPLYKRIYQYFKKKEALFLAKADHVISLTQKGVQEMLQWRHAHLRTNRVTVIPCCADIDLFDRGVDASRQKAIAATLGIQPSDVVLSYLGSIGTWYMLDEMLDFFVAFKTKFPQSRFLFITHDEHQRIIDTALSKGLAREDIILQGAKRTEVPVLLSLSRYSIFFIRPTYSKSASSPTKQGELMAMGIPVICNAGVGDTDAVVKDTKAGVLVQDFTNEAYKAALDELERTKFDPAQIRQNAIAQFSLDKGVQAYLDVYQRLLPQKALV
jgi:glycosyltransferase involved in cell wall biosynthesis